MTESDIARCRAIARRICRQWGAQHLRQDAEQEACMAYWQCCLEHDPQHGNAWQLGTKRVPGAVMDFLQRQHFNSRRDWYPRPGDFTAVLDYMATFDPRTHDHPERIDECLQRLPKCYRELIKRRFWDGLKKCEIAAEMGIHATRVSQIEAAALKCMRRAA